MPTVRSRPHPRRSTAAVLALVAGLTGCSAADGSAEPAPSSNAASTSAAPAATSTPSPTPGQDVRVVEVHIVDGAVHTESDRVDVAAGEAIRLIVTSDVDDELHVHGIDQTAALVADQPTTMEFSIDEPGIFEVETHDSGRLLVQLSVR